MGTTLPPYLKDKLSCLIRENFDMFAWIPTDMLGIDPKVICHRLDIDPKANPMAQKKRKLKAEQQQAT